MESDELIPIDIEYEREDLDLEDELDEVAELPPPKKAKTKSKNKTNNEDKKRRRTSTVWRFFQMLPTKDEEKPTCKCKKCGKEYIAAGAYGTGNLKQHLMVCPRKDTTDVGQLILGQNAMSKLYGYASSLQYVKVREKLFALFGEYVSNVSAPSISSEMAGQATQETEEQYANEGSLFMMQEFDSFHSMDMGRQAQKTQLELYLDEPRVDRNAKLDILAFWKGNEFRYPELAAMARDVLSIPISTVASESTFSVGGRVIDQFRSALKPDVVEALVCSRDWLYADIELAQSELEELTEDIMTMNINKDEHIEDTSSMGPSISSNPVS